MKAKSKAAVKTRPEPRIDWIQPIYSSAASDSMERATGLRFVRDTASPASASPAPVVPAKDAE